MYVYMVQEISFFPLNTSVPYENMAGALPYLKKDKKNLCSIKAHKSLSAQICDKVGNLMRLCYFSTE